MLRYQSDIAPDNPPPHTNNHPYVIYELSLSFAQRNYKEVISTFVEYSIVE